MAPKWKILQGMKNPLHRQGFKLIFIPKENIPNKRDILNLQTNIHTKILTSSIQNSIHVFQTWISSSSSSLLLFLFFFSSSLSPSPLLSTGSPSFQAKEMNFLKALFGLIPIFTSNFIFCYLVLNVKLPIYPWLLY